MLFWLNQNNPAHDALSGSVVQKRAGWNVPSCKRINHGIAKIEEILFYINARNAIVCLERRPDAHEERMRFQERPYFFKRCNPQCGYFIRIPLERFE